jgi:hypothetical protein
MVTLRVASIPLQWSACHPSEPRSGDCGGAGPRIIHLRLYPTSAAPRFPWHLNAHGFALSAPPPGFGVFAGVFVERVESLARRERQDPGRMLGHFIAHEIGHLLLGGGEHAAEGLMKAPWNRQDLARMVRGDLLFRSGEAAALRANLHARPYALSQNAVQAVD